MDFLKPEFEEALTPTIDGSTVSIGRFTYTASEILKQAGEEPYEEVFRDWLWEEWLPSKRDRRDELLEFRTNAARYEDLKRIVENGGAVPFVGSGMSQPTGMPLWSDFLRQSCQHAKGYRITDLNQHLKSGLYEEAASAIFGAMPDRLFDDCFMRSFTLRSESLISGPVLLLPKLFDSIVITTNFDRVIEETYATNNTHFQAVLDGQNISNYRRQVAAGSRCLLKLHGDLENKHARVLLKDEYDAFYADECPGREELTLIYRRGGLLFMGCSLQQDRTIDLLEEIAKSDTSMPSHFALLPAPKPRKLLEREHFLAERNIFPIWYDGDPSDDIEAIIVGLLEDLKKL